MIKYQDKYYINGKPDEGYLTVSKKTEHILHNSIEGIKGVTIGTHSGNHRDSITVHYGKISFQLSLFNLGEMLKRVTVINGVIQDRLLLCHEGNYFCLVPVGTDWYDTIVINNMVRQKQVFTVKDLQLGSVITFAKDPLVDWVYLGEKLELKPSISAERILKIELTKSYHFGRVYTIKNGKWVNGVYEHVDQEQYSFEHISKPKIGFMKGVDLDSVAKLNNQLNIPSPINEGKSIEDQWFSTIIENPKTDDIDVSGKSYVASADELREAKIRIDPVSRSKAKIITPVLDLNQEIDLKSFLPPGGTLKGFNNWGRAHNSEFSNIYHRINLIF